MAIKSTADKVATIQNGYALDGPTIELGAAIVDGELHKDAPVRLPLATTGYAFASPPLRPPALASRHAGRAPPLPA